MTSLPPSPLAPGPTGGSEPLDPPFPPAPVEELLRLVIKAARAQQLYLPNNPIYRGAIDALRGGFRTVWSETDELVLTIGETQIRWFDAVVAGELGDKSSDNLAWLFYKDGIRELRLTAGFEETEVVKLLEIIKRARKASPDEDDLVTMFWEGDFTQLAYKYVDLLQEARDELADGTEVQPASQDEVRRNAQEAIEESKANNIVDMSDFDATLYFLDEKEIAYLHAEIEREYQHNLRMNVAAVLLDIFEHQVDPKTRMEVLDNVETLLLYMLTAGDFRAVAEVLREARTAHDRAPETTDEQRARLAQLADRLSAPAALAQLLQALDDAPELPPIEELGSLFDQLRPSALATVFEWLPRVRADGLRPLLEAAAGRLAAANTAELVRLIQSPEREISNEAIRRAGALKAQAAVLAITRVLDDESADRRRLAVNALSEIGSPGSMQALEKMVEDTDRDVRVAAVRVFMARSYRPVLPRLEAAVKNRAVRDADLTEKMAFFECYGALCGDSGVEHLDGLLNGKGFLGRREDPEARACAAMALGRIGTPRALEALRKSAGEKDIVVRNAVSRAMRGAGSA